MSFIVLCPRALTKGPASIEWLFLRDYLSRLGDRGIVADKTWSALRARIIAKHGEARAEGIIAELRGSFAPETQRLQADYQEEPAVDYPDDELIIATRDLVDRRAAEIGLFIAEDPTTFQGIDAIHSVTLDQWFYARMNNPADREMMQAFLERYAYKNAE